MAEVAKKAARQLPGFKLGQKQVFLPNHVITFLHKEHLPPNEAAFKVPLRFTKFDLRDYLWNLYNVEVKKVRSYVKQQPLTQRNSHSRSWYRPQPLKIMNVELVKPFQWPELPTNTDAWNSQLWKMREELMDKRNQDHVNRQRSEIPLKSKEPLSKERQELATLAKQILSGQVKWTNDVVLDPKWEKLLDKQPAKIEDVPKEDTTEDIDLAGSR